MTGALLLAGAGTGHAGRVAATGEILRALGFTVYTDAPTVQSDVSVVIAGPDDAGALDAWQAAGAVCIATSGLPEPVTEAAILAALASHHYLALSAREAAGIADAIADQTAGDADFAAELAQALVTSTETDLAQLRAADGDLETLRSIAHRLKSSAHYVGCQTLRVLAQRLEHAARDGDAATAVALAAIFEPTVARLLELLAVLPARK
ncbi:Hpt domain-containing protein [Cupriavidus necator]|uniref:Hpt domain-containing protein n=1 Tax=Cupriavidus necator TaxID=106590 RepID=UPI00339D70BC